MIDNLQFCNLFETVFRQLRAGQVDAHHVAFACHEGFGVMVLNLERWNCWFDRFDDLIVRGTSVTELARARASGRTTVFFGFQTPNPIEDDTGLLEIVHQPGVRLMHWHVKRPFLATSCFADEDTGLTCMGRRDESRWSCHRHGTFRRTFDAGGNLPLPAGPSGSPMPTPTGPIARAATKPT